MTEAMNPARGASAGKSAVTTRNTARAGGSVSGKSKRGMRLPKHVSMGVLKFNLIKCV